VESHLSLICLRMVREKPGTSPCCMDAGWYTGSVKVVACDSQRSADLYKQASSKLGEVYEGANIVALDWCDVPSRPRARIWLPAAIKAPEDILFMLQECNPHLPTRKPAANSSATCAPAPKAAVGTAKALGPPAGANK